MSSKHPSIYKGHILAETGTKVYVADCYAYPGSRRTLSGKVTEIRLQDDGRNRYLITYETGQSWVPLEYVFEREDEAKRFALGQAHETCKKQIELIKTRIGEDGKKLEAQRKKLVELEKLIWGVHKDA